MSSLAWLGSTVTFPEGVITPEQYGAIGDGTADDTAALGAALADLEVGDTLWISPDKVYTHSTMADLAAPRRGPGSASSAWTWLIARYDVELTNPGGIPTRLLQGAVIVDPETTRG